MALSLSGAAVLSACMMAAPPTAKPHARPAGLIKTPVAPNVPVVRSKQSRDLAVYYARVQADLLAQGLMRTDGGGPDTQFGPSELQRNFTRIAFYNEHSASSLSQGDGRVGALHRWRGPVRIRTEFGPSVGPATRTKDRAIVSAYGARLARVTKHPIAVTQSDSANFHVLIMGQDDRDYMVARIREIAPDISPSALSVFRTLSRPIHCLVAAFPNAQNEYTMAIAVIRAEHPDLLRRACVHEELAQGLGLANDSPAARPSIFNDDDEFALLTTHDEKLLAMLYDRRLFAGMSLDRARPIIQQLALEQAGNAGF